MAMSNKTTIKSCHEKISERQNGGCKNSIQNLTLGFSLPNAMQILICLGGSEDSWETASAKQSKDQLIFSKVIYLKFIKIFLKSDCIYYNWRKRESEMSGKNGSEKQINECEECSLSIEGANGKKNSKEKNLANSSKGLQKFTPSCDRSNEDDKPEKEQWRHSEIKKIFTLYLEFGSQWKLIQTQFSDRSSNSIKNRFYTVVRTFLKVLFRQHPCIKKKLPHEIPSKIILKFYEGREEFVRFKGFGKRILKSVDYDLESLELRTFAKNNLEDIKLLYELVFAQKEQDPCVKPMEKGRKKKLKVEENQIQQKTEPIVQNKAQSKTDVCYEEEQNLPLPPITYQGDLPQMPQMGFMFMPTPNYYGIIGYNQYFTYC